MVQESKSSTLQRSTEGTARQTRRRSPVTEPGYRKGRRAWNKGRQLPAELLTAAEVQALLATFTGLSVTARRDRAIVTLIYRHGVKVGQIVLLARWHYDPDSGRLTVPASGRVHERVVQLDSATREALDLWLDARRELRLRPTAPLFSAIAEGAKGKPLRTGYVQRMLARRATRAGIEKRVHSEGLRKTGERERGNDRPRSMETSIKRHLEDEGFRSRFPTAYERWLDAMHLYDRNPERHATRIGHDCREALIEFASALFEVVNLEAEGRPEQTVSRLRAIVRSQEPSLGEKTTALLESLIAYWGTVSDLVQRQEHGAAKEGEPITAEDSRRVVLHTALAMYELDRAVRQAAT